MFIGKVGEEERSISFLVSCMNTEQASSLSYKPSFYRTLNFRVAMHVT